jgi:signal peptidase I
MDDITPRLLITPPTEPFHPDIVAPIVPNHVPIVVTGKNPATGKLRSILSTLAVLLIAPLLALGITAYIFQSYEVDGPSMQSTLQNHDRLIIWKFARTIARGTHNSYIPNRGDVVVFIKRGLYEDSNNKEKQLIKRVIGLPGERVTVKDGKITVYNSANPDGFSPDATLPYGKVITTTEGNIDITVPADEVFVCGDNRANSLDSRYFGPISADDIVGKLAARILPLGQATKF